MFETRGDAIYGTWVNGLTGISGLVRIPAAGKQTSRCVSSCCYALFTCCVVFHCYTSNILQWTR